MGSCIPSIDFIMEYQDFLATSMPVQFSWVKQTVEVSCQKAQSHKNCW